MLNQSQCQSTVLDICFLKISYWHSIKMHCHQNYSHIIHFLAIQKQGQQKCLGQSHHGLY